MKGTEIFKNNIYKSVHITSWQRSFVVELFKKKKMLQDLLIPAFYLYITIIAQFLYFVYTLTYYLSKISRYKTNNFKYVFLDSYKTIMKKKCDDWETMLEFLKKKKKHISDIISLPSTFIFLFFLWGMEKCSKEKQCVFE